MTRYQKVVVAVLAFIQFSVILDLMIIGPLGVIIMPSLNITPQQFGFTVSIYAIAAGISGIASAGFSDRFDRKKFLMFFYCGFIVGTLLCGLATNYYFLLFARLVTGLFGGVMASVIFAIAADLFPYELRGRVIGIIQTAFATSQILGMPIGFYIAHRWSWHAPFYAIVAVATLVGVVIMAQLKPITGHIGKNPDRNPFHHLWLTVTNREYQFAFSTLLLMNASGFMIFPFLSAFIVHNIGVSQGMLPTLFLISGVCMMLSGPLAGRMADKFGKLPVIVFGTCLIAPAVLIQTQMGLTIFPIAIAVNVGYTVAVTIRMIPYMALITAVPSADSRGAFTAINSALGHLAGVAAGLSGFIVTEAADGRIENFNRLGYISAGVTIIVLLQAYVINKRVSQKLTKAKELKSA